MTYANQPVSSTYSSSYPVGGQVNSGYTTSTYVNQPNTYTTTEYVSQPANTYTTTEYVNQPVSSTYTTTEYVNQPGTTTTYTTSGYQPGTYVSGGSGVHGSTYETTNVHRAY